MNLNTRSLGLALLLLLLFLGATVTLQWWLRRETRQLQGMAVEEARERLGRAVAVSGRPPDKWDAAFQHELGAMLGGTVELFRADAPPAVLPAGARALIRQGQHPLRHRVADENLLLEGEIGQAFFIIVAGQVKVVKDGKLLNVLKEGDCFGEMAYLSGDRARRSASIVSVSEVQLLKIQATHLESLSEGCQLRFNREFLRTLIERLTWTSSVLAQFRR